MMLSFFLLFCLFIFGTWVNYAFALGLWLSLQCVDKGDILAKG